VPATALAHFNEDLCRARAILTHADTLPAATDEERMLRIHNCDRPRMRPQELARSGTVLKVNQDVEFLVHRCDEHINAEFRQFLQGMGCSPATIAAAGY
jgi:hypothetical protein